MPVDKSSIKLAKFDFSMDLFRRLLSGLFVNEMLKDILSFKIAIDWGTYPILEGNSLLKKGAKGQLFK